MRRRHALYLSEAMTERLELVAETHRLSKSEILERALQVYLTQDADGRPSNLCGLQQEQNGKALKRLERDVAIATELLATFVGYFLTITPPLPANETEAARALGRLRFDQVIAGIAHRLKTDRHLIARVLDKLRQGDQPTPTAGTRGAAPADAPVNRSVRSAG
jgi:predicted transcriptional regulator